MTMNEMLNNEVVKIYLEEMLKYKIAELTSKDRINIYIDTLENGGYAVNKRELNKFLTEKAQEKINSMPAGTRF